MRQGDLFAAATGPVAPAVAEKPDPSVIRSRLHAILETARSAAEMPWEPRRARVLEHLFPNMASWLPAEERDALRATFAAEMERLRDTPARQ